MASPYVIFAPKQVNPCSATWLVGSDSGNAHNDSPTFGPANETHPVAAWSYLVDGPLKKVLTGSYESIEAAVAAWAEAGGEVVVSIHGSGVSGVSMPIPKILILGNGQPIWNIDSGVITDPALIWTVRFSVPHSIIK